jgi:hypothetical protein
MTDKEMTDAVSRAMELLRPMSPEDRLRVVHASLMLLGDPISVTRGLGKGLAAEDEEETGMDGLHAKARLWMKQNEVSTEELQQVVHLSGGAADVIAGDIPGKNKKDKTYSAYVLAGLGAFLATASWTFDDRSARSLCERYACYDQANHSATIKGRGNEFTGTKEGGWTLTMPGQKRAAALVKEIGRLAK